MPGRPCTPGAGAANDLASADVAGHGHRFRLGVDQPDYLRLLRFFVATPPVLRFDACSCPPSPFGDPKGDILRVSSASGFNPASEPKVAEADPGQCRELSGAEPSARFGSGASPRMPWKTVRRCPSGMCRPACRTGVSASPCLDADGPLAGKSTCGRLPTSPTTFQDVPRGTRAGGHHRQRRVKTPPSGYPWWGMRIDGAESAWARPGLRPEAREGDFPPGKSRVFPVKYRGFPCSCSERRWRYFNSIASCAPWVA